MGGDFVIVSLMPVLFIGFILGIKHSLEPDHVIAVSTMVGDNRKLSRSTLTGVFWGIGHTSTLFIVGMLLVLLKGDIPEEWVMSLEFLVGIMLVYLGVKNIRSLKKTTNHQHVDQHKSTFLKTFMIGFIHGLAGSAAMVLLTLSTVSSIWECALYIVIFGLGTVIGMLSFSTIIGIPFVFSKKNIKVNRTLTRTAGTVSFLFGLYYMYNLGVTEGLFKLWAS